jgi:hypothetical protein
MVVGSLCTTMSSQSLRKRRLRRVTVIGRRRSVQAGRRLPHPGASMSHLWRLADSSETSRQGRVCQGIVADVARMCFGVDDQLGNGLGRHRWVRDHHHG